MKSDELKVRKVDSHVWEIARVGGMNVPGRVFASDALMEAISGDNSLLQVAHVAFLPGIEKYSLAMPDIHWGYGFPIGSVAATNPSRGGVVSPGGVGYDINCGVRLATTQLTEGQVRPRLKDLITRLYQTIPCGVGGGSVVGKLSRGELDRVLRKGAGALIERGMATQEDLDLTEEAGCLEGADPDSVSDRAFERGARQLGSLGSGNHFLEVQVVDEVFDPGAAHALGLDMGTVAIMIHSGSRGLGYQVCDDFLKVMDRCLNKYHIPLPDRQLACAPLSSTEGQEYLGAMKCAANFAWANRQAMMHRVRTTVEETLGMSPADVGMRLVYDVCHNIAKMETHTLEGRDVELCVHRKGATRSLPPGHPLVPKTYRDLGQPVLVPGDMGRYSFVCLGGRGALEHSFGSSCHGAGRSMSRNQAVRTSRGRSIVKELERKGIQVQAKGYRTVAEEMPEAYKDVAEVVGVMHAMDISRRVARLRPVGVVKG